LAHASPTRREKKKEKRRGGRKGGNRVFWPEPLNFMYMGYEKGSVGAGRRGYRNRKEGKRGKKKG